MVVVVLALVPKNKQDGNFTKKFRKAAWNLT